MTEETGFRLRNLPLEVTDLSGSSPYDQAYVVADVRDRITQEWDTAKLLTSVLTPPDGSPVLTESITTNSLVSGASETGTIDLAMAFLLSAIATDHPCRLKLYDSVANRDAAGMTGLLFDIELGSGESTPIDPVVPGVNRENPQGIAIAYNLENIDTVSRVISLTLSYIIIH